MNHSSSIKAAEHASLLGKDGVENSLKDTGDDRSSKPRGAWTAIACIASVALIAAAGVRGYSSGLVSSLGDDTTPQTLANAPGPKLNIPFFIIADTHDTVDKQRGQNCLTYVYNAFKKFRGMTDQELGNFVHLVPAIFPKRWPEQLNLAKDAIQQFLGQSDAVSKDGKQPEMQWPMRAVLDADQKNGGKCMTDELGEFCPRDHHLGCMLSHASVWSKMHEAHQAGAPASVLWESDGDGTLVGLSVLDYPNVVHEMPADADLIWTLGIGERSPGQFVKKFPSTAVGTRKSLGNNPNFDDSAYKHVYMYKFDKICGWAGAKAMIITKSGAEKIINFVNRYKHADMVDAWLAGHCTEKCDPASSEPCMQLNCYTAQGKGIPKEVMGGVLPSWYDDDNLQQSQSVDAAVVKDMELNHDRYNREGCARSKLRENSQQSFEAFVSIGRTEENYQHTVRGCIIRPFWSKRQIDPCNPGQHLPLNPKTLGARLGKSEETEEAETFDSVEFDEFKVVGGN